MGTCLEPNSNFEYCIGACAKVAASQPFGDFSRVEGWLEFIVFSPLLNVSRVAYFIRRDKDRFNYDFDDIDCLIDRLDLLLSQSSKGHLPEDIRLCD